MAFICLMKFIFSLNMLSSVKLDCCLLVWMTSDLFILLLALLSLLSLINGSS